jgi:hypothetical protein
VVDDGLKPKSALLADILAVANAIRVGTLFGSVVLLRDNRSAQKSAAFASPPLSLAGWGFQGFGCGKFPISVWLGARGTRMQFTCFIDRCTTRRTRHGQYLFQREFFGFHSHIIMRRSTAEKCPIMLTSPTLQQTEAIELDPHDFVALAGGTLKFFPVLDGHVAT